VRCIVCGGSVWLYGVWIRPLGVLSGVVGLCWVGSMVVVLGCIRWIRWYRLCKCR
jgi:hypothetical protein